MAGDSGCGELIRDLGGGLVVPPDAPGALARALDRLLGDPGRWRRAARDAGAAARVRFGPDAVAARVEAIYREALTCAA